MKRIEFTVELIHWFVDFLLENLLAKFTYKWEMQIITVYLESLLLGVFQELLYFSWDLRFQN
jgi:hypothetical protein